MQKVHDHPEEMAQREKFLGGGRYQLHRKQAFQQWTPDIYEICWEAQDLHQGGMNVTVCELGLPKMGAVTRQAHLRTAMRAFVKGGHSRLPSLANVFRENERDFFVFSRREDKTLLERQRTGHLFQEQEIIMGCLQITEMLEALSTQEVPLIHGLINPTNIVVTKNDQWVLINFSVVLASGALPHLANLDSTLFPPFIAPDFTQGIIDSRSDLYALLATAYFALTGDLLARTGGNIRNRQLLASRISPQFESILKKGLDPTAIRYQQISALHQDLLALSPIRDSQPSLSGRVQRRMLQEQGRVPSVPEIGPDVSPIEAIQQSIPKTQKAPDDSHHTAVAQIFSSLASPDELAEPGKKLLPHPSELPPMREGNDALAASLVMGSILVFSLLPVFIKG